MCPVTKLAAGIFSRSPAACAVSESIRAQTSPVHTCSYGSRVFSLSTAPLVLACRPRLLPGQGSAERLCAPVRRWRTSARSGRQCQAPRRASCRCRRAWMRPGWPTGRAPWMSSTAWVMARALSLCRSPRTTRRHAFSKTSMSRRRVQGKCRCALTISFAWPPPARPTGSGLLNKLDQRPKRQQEC